MGRTAPRVLAVAILMIAAAFFVVSCGSSDTLVPTGQPAAGGGGGGGGGPVGAAPVITGGPTANRTTVNEGDQVFIELQANDPDGDPLTFAFQAAPGGGVAPQAEGTNGTFSSDPSASGTFWTAPDVDGDTNFDIQVTVSDGNGNQTQGMVGIQVNNVRDGNFAFGAPMATPDTVFVEDDGTIRVVIPITPAPTTAELVMLADDGSVAQVLGTLTDDGDLNNGDEIGQDGIFSTIVVLDTADARVERLAVRAVNGTTELSSTFNVLVAEHLTQEEVQAIIDLQTEAENVFDQTLADTGDPVQAQQAALDVLLGGDNVLQAGPAPEGFGLWVLYQKGLLGGLERNPDGTRSGPRQPREPGPSQFYGSEPLAVEHGDASSETIAAAAVDDGTNRVGNKKAIVLGAFNFDFGNTDDAPEIRDIIEDKVCPEFDVTYLLDANVTVEVLRTLSEYGLIAMTSHGDTWYNGILSLFVEKWGWSFWGAQVVVLTSQTADPANLAPYEADLLHGRLLIHGAGFFAITPAFVSAYGAGYPNSVVYIGACRSTYNNSLANAFLAKGAGAYFGYSEYVLSAFAKARGIELFTGLVEDDETTGDAFIPGQSDNSNPPAFWQMVGANDLQIPAGDRLLNCDFELGSLEGWTTDGDARVITQLFGTVPTQPQYMAIISTGLGFSIDSGSISQTICLPADSETLRFDWNFFSEEFDEYCGSIFQDTFEVSIVDGGVPTVLFTRTIDDLCGSVSPSGAFFDQSGPGCTPDDGNDCNVGTTGWQTAELDISAIAAATQGRDVTIVFRTFDVGDSIFDSAVLLDQIEIISAP